MRTQFNIITILVILASGLAFALPVAAETLFKYIDEQGNVTFADRQLSSGEQVSARQVEKDAPEQRFFIHLRGSRSDGTLQAINQYFGPVEVRLEIKESSNVIVDRPLPVRFVVPARGELAAANVRQDKKFNSFSYHYSYRVVFGDPASQHEPRRPYRAPVPVGQVFHISQAFGGETTHNDDQNRYAVDIPMPEGTPVHAARGGVIMDVANDFFVGGTDENLGRKSNYVRILHDDGTMAVYAHLKLETLQFPIGTRVVRGQMIAHSGNTGYSSGPHLHFAVQKNVGMKLVSIPFQFTDADGRGFTPRKGAVVMVN